MAGEDLLDKSGTSQHGSVREISHPHPDDLPQGQLAVAPPLRFDLRGAEAPTRGTDHTFFVLHISGLPLVVKPEPVERRGGFPVPFPVLPANKGRMTQNAPQALSRPAIASDSRGVATPPVVLDPLNHPGADGIQVDVGGHGHEGFFITLHQDALEALLPERALAPHAPVIPLGEALLELLHEDRDVAHAALVAGENLRFPNAVAGGRGAVKFLADSLHGEAIIQEPEAAEKGVAVQGRKPLPVGYLDEEMEVV